ncbi:oxidoreductase [Pleomorphomonas diazotrophica]|uniref:Oxidoreductase n=1 Tax=Pleomorphomonas diazotrophica TaxID=1166257 RepID=A0A1I4WFE6_9HYPH|nr:MDR family oxidoreductase [Pleomorphomonas diazotrophica]PKR88992.1 oxidoreductase [Pleomorphomonas diazotrophica]SFN11709.1 acrylyl-CoA reductase (NADPH) [Pleomorphomonas diazotrophica]
MTDFAAVLLERDEEGRTGARLTRLADSDLMAGEVTLAVRASAVNFKDGLAVTGRLPVVRRWPMVPGIDAAGVVIASEDARWQPGDEVILTGWGVGETHLGGWSEKMRVSGDWLVRRPAALSPVEAMALGTAGVTVAEGLDRLARLGVTPADGSIVVTGAAGGVGSLAVMLLAREGWSVTAVTGRPEEAERLRRLGAVEVIGRDLFMGPVKPLGRERWAAAFDMVGSAMLAHVLSMLKPGGAAIACGNAAGMDLPASLAPFILRGVSLIGVDSVRVPKARREAIWSRLADIVDRQRLAAMTAVVDLTEAIDAGHRIVEGGIAGRMVVAIGDL